MSYIHDALKRSQAQRQQAKASLTDNNDAVVHSRHVEKRRLVPWVPLSLLVLGVGLSLLAYRIGTTPELLQSSASDAENKLVVTSEAEPPKTPEPVMGQSNTQPRPILVSTPYERLPFYWELPQPIRVQLGELAVTIHVYANHPEQRFLFLNNREYRAGEQMPSGVKVERIEPQGVVLSYADQVFRLPRPR